MARRRQLSTQDQFWLEMDRPNNLMVVDAVMWTAEPLDWDRLRVVMDERFAGRYPVFRSLAVHDDDGSWWWEESPDYDLDNHVEMVTLDDPSDPRGLQRLIADRRTSMLDRSKPLWEAIWVEEYLGGSAVVLRSHHSIADGVRMVELALTLFDAGPDGGSVHDPGDTTHAAKPRAAASGGNGSGTAGTRPHVDAGRIASGARRSARSLIGRVPDAAREAARLARASVVNPVGAGHGFITETAHDANYEQQADQALIHAVLTGGGV